MKETILIIVLLTLFSCQSFDKPDKPEYCTNEIELLKGNSDHLVNFDFNLSAKEQIENIQKQVNISLCRGVTTFNGTFHTGKSDIEIFLITDWYCTDSTINPDESPPPCVIIRSKEVLINSDNKILTDGRIVPSDSLTNLIYELSKEFYWDNSFNLAAFQIKWDKDTDITAKVKAFKALVNGYLKAANEISLTQYKGPLCELDSSGLKELKQKFRFAYLIRKEIPPLYHLK